MDEGLLLILSVFAFCFGTSIASFLNVVIWRVPRGESIVSPPSHCPTCGASIRWYQNIPLVSWLALRGKCASCKAPISPRYILVESLGGVLFLAAFWRFGYFAPLAWIWISLMIVGSFIDFDSQLLPDFVTVGGIVYGLVVSLVFWVLAEGTTLTFSNFTSHSFVIDPLVSVGGLAVGFGLLGLVRWLGSVAFKREAMGLGDVFLMGAIGAVCGPVAVLVTLVLSSVFGSVVGIVMILFSKIRLGKFVAIPFGPYLCLGCLAWLFYGPELVDWYLELLHF